jgi:methylenetetrahydrofolate reductase (NADPH)
MTFQSLYGAGAPRYSFEVFPPKVDADNAALFATLDELRRFNPAFISVTYGAMGTTRDLTRDIALQIHNDKGLNTAFHFTCVGTDRDSIRTYVEHLKKKGVNMVVALRGDPPAGTTAFVPTANGFAHANELVSFLKDLGGFGIAVAGYPEKHIEATSSEEDLHYLKQKVDAGANIVITQLFFDNTYYFDFVDRARKIGIEAPIIPGIMPILSLKQVEKITRLCGASLPKTFHQELAKHEGDAKAMREIGIHHAIAQCQELIDRDVPGIHFYTLNKSESTKQVLENLNV